MLIAIATFIGVVGSVVAVYQFVEDRRRKAVSWHHVDKLVVELVNEIERRPSAPDLIVGVGRGGALIAAMIATNLEGRIELACVDTEGDFDEAGRKHVVLRHPESLPDVSGKHVLVVVAELYSGQDMRDAIDYLETHGARRIETLAVLAGPSSNVRPDYVGQVTKHEPLAPWRLTDAARHGRI
jgi:hypoxanthine phosphoribosyltransferase